MAQNIIYHSYRNQLKQFLDCNLPLLFHIQFFFQSKTSLTTTVIKLDTLANSVGPPPRIMIFFLFDGSASHSELSEIVSLISRIHVGRE